MSKIIHKLSNPEGLPFEQDLSLKKQILSYVSDWLYLSQCLTSFSSINHFLYIYAWFFILFHGPPYNLENVQVPTFEAILPYIYFFWEPP